MESLLGVAGFLLAGAATPGPNNLVVWQLAARRGFASALPAITGVVLGGLLLLVVAMFGLDALFNAVPWLRIALVAAGCIYLAWLGITLIARPGRGESNADSRRLPEGLTGLLVFQFVNPKGWVLMATVASALPASSGTAVYAGTVGLFLLISLACLGAWAALGQLFATVCGTGVAAWFERSMGCLLVASAVLLLLGK